MLLALAVFVCVVLTVINVAGATAKGYSAPGVVLASVLVSPLLVWAWVVVAPVREQTKSASSFDYTAR